MSPVIFNFGTNSVRVVQTAGGPVFVAKDVCAAFGDSDHKRSVSRLDEDEREMVQITDSMGRPQMATGVNESGLYALLFMMQPEMARTDGGAQNTPHIQDRIARLKAFKKWVTSEVLPAIRRTGQFSVVPQPEPSPFQIPATLPEALRLAADTMDQLDAARKELADAAPKLVTYDRVMDGDGLFTFRQTAATFPEKGIGGNNLVKILIEERILYRDAKGHILAFRQYIERGYFKGIESPYEIKATGESRVSVQIKVTPAGVEFIAKKLTERERRAS